ncbi:HTTM domain-containing protein [Catenulispora yoronensis]|uniref:HTTM domain-containing protein n=1 Tax=Catenulispora yoronensis TaxID=450799 RepID=UPI0031DF5A75
MTIADGGAAIAVIVSGLLIPQCLGDTRLTHWACTDAPLAPAWRGSAYAAHLVLRIQVAIIYLDTAYSKARNPAWRHGQVLRIIMQDPQFGAPDPIRIAVSRLLNHDWLGSVLTWSVLIIEVGIGSSMFCVAIYRRYATVIAVAFHLFIMILMGLFGFALIMMAVVALASLNTSPRKAVTSADRDQSLRSVIRLRLRLRGLLQSADRSHGTGSSRTADVDA